MKKQFTWDFALFSANLHAFMPTINWHKHIYWYTKWLKYHEPQPITTSEYWIWPSEPCFKEAKESVILCLFHLGYHAQIPRLLANRNIPFDMIVDKRFFEANKEELLVMQEELASSGMTYRFLFSEDPKVLLKARATIKEGRHILVFADGNSGAGTKLNRVSIKFFDKQMEVRKGIALLSHILKTKIYCLEPTKNEGHLILGMHLLMEPENFKNRDTYIKDAMQLIYKRLEDKLRLEPYKWEAWAYLHEMACFEMGNTNVDSINDQIIPQSWLPVKLGGEYGYFDRIHYRFIRLS